MIAMVSGGFDPLHEGHIELIELAAAHGNVIVALNTDEWLENKKGYIFMPWETRRRILMALEHVVEVIPAGDEDGSVCSAIANLKPDFFVNGGDGFKLDSPERKLCIKLGITEINAGAKVQSSSDLIHRVVDIYPFKNKRNKLV